MIDLPSMRTQNKRPGSAGLAAKHFSTARRNLAAGRRFFQKLGIDVSRTLEMLSRLENHLGSSCPTMKFRASRDLKLWLNAFSPACNAGPL